MDSLFFCFVLFCFQKAVEEEESQVKKSSAELFSPSSKPGETDPVRKVAHWFPSFRPIYLSQSAAPASCHVFSSPPPPPPSLTQKVSSQGHRAHADRHPPPPLTHS